MRLVFLFVAALLQAQTVVPVEPALAEIAHTHRFREAAISPDGAHLAYVEAKAAPNQSAIYIAPRIRVTAGDGRVACDERGVSWSADGKHLAFLSDCGKKEQLQLYVAPAEGGAARQLTHLKGLLADPNGRPTASGLRSYLPRTCRTQPVRWTPCRPNPACWNRRSSNSA